MRELILPNEIRYGENPENPLWIAIMENMEIKNGVSIMFITARTHAEAIKKAEIECRGELFYLNSMWDMFKRLEMQVENENRR